MSATTKVFTSSIGELHKINEDNLLYELLKIKKGDILFFHTQSKEDFEPRENNRYPGHVGIYLGDFRYINASTGKGFVGIENLLNPKKLKKFVGYKNVVDSFEYTTNKNKIFDKKMN